MMRVINRRPGKIKEPCMQGRPMRMYSQVSIDRGAEHDTIRKGFGGSLPPAGVEVSALVQPHDPNSPPRIVQHALITHRPCAKTSHTLSWGSI